MKSMKDMSNAFQIIAEQQVGWLSNTLPLLMKSQVITRYDEQSETTRDHEEANSVRQDGTSMVKYTLDINNIMHSRIRKDPKLNKNKVISEFRRRVSGEEKKVEIIEYEEPLDPFSRFDFIDTLACNLDEPIELKWFPPVEISAFKSKQCLLPFPSILPSRKLHGKTLPPVQSSQGFANPFK